MVDYIGVSTGGETPAEEVVNVRGGASAGGTDAEPARFDPRSADLSLASLFAGWALADELQRRLEAEGHGRLRMADGLVFQHLIAGPCAIGDLAARMGVSQQAASKAVADLERRGYVRREADPADGRSRRAALTGRGEAAVEAGRRERAAIEAELAKRLGPRRVEAARRTLVDVVDALGGAGAIRGRRVRPPA
jgi:DNA-binding MarR family transcriptional regulator